MDVDDTQYHGEAFNNDTGEFIDFKSRPRERCECFGYDTDVSTALIASFDLPKGTAKVLNKRYRSSLCHGLFGSSTCR